MKLWIAIGALVLLAVAGIYQTSAKTPERSASTAASSPATSPATTQPDKREVIKVKTAAEFVKAIGPDRIIQLASGEYNLTAVEKPRLKYVRWTSEGEFIVRGAKNLRIEGAGDKRVRVVVESSDIYVLGVERASDVELVNLEIGHLESPRGCECGVVEIVGCENVVIRNCDLYGCGAEGLNISRSAGLRFLRSIIRDCSCGIMSVEGCQDLLFKDSTFSRNKQRGFTFRDSDDIAFDNCTTENNKAVVALFDTGSCSNVTVNGGSINGNAYTKIMETENSVKVEKVDFAGNKIVAGPGE